MQNLFFTEPPRELMGLTAEYEDARQWIVDNLFFDANHIVSIIIIINKDSMMTHIENITFN